MEELELIVQRMMDAGESEESIAQVIKTYDPKKAIDPVKEAANAGSVEKAANGGSQLENGSSEYKENTERDLLVYNVKETQKLIDNYIAAGNEANASDLKVLEEYKNDLDSYDNAQVDSGLRSEVTASYNKIKKNAKITEFGTLDFGNEKQIDDFYTKFNADFFKNNKTFQEEIIPNEKAKLEGKTKKYIASLKEQMGLDNPENVTQEKIDELQNKVQSWYSNNLKTAISKNPEYIKITDSFSRVSKSINEPQLNRYLRGKDSPNLLKAMDLADQIDSVSPFPVSKIARVFENVINSGRKIDNSLNKAGTNKGLAYEVEKEKRFNVSKKQIEKFGSPDTQGVWVVDERSLKNNWRFIPKKDIYGSGKETAWSTIVAGKEYKEGSFSEFEKSFTDNKEKQYDKIGSRMLELQDTALGINSWDDSEFDEIIKGNDVVSNLIGLAADQLPQMALAFVTLGISSGAQIGSDIYAEGIDIEASKRFNIKEGEIPSLEQRSEILKDEDFINSLEAKALGGGFIAGQLERFGAGKTISAFSKVGAKAMLRGGYKNFLKSVANGAIANTQLGVSEAVTEILQEIIQASASGGEINANQLFEAGGTGFLVSAATGLGGNIKSQSAAEVKAASRMIAGKLNSKSTEALFNSKIKEIDLAIKESTNADDITDLENKKEIVLETRNANISLPKDFTAGNKSKAIDLIVKRNKLIKETEGKIPELIESEKIQIENINNSLRNLAANNFKSIQREKGINTARKLLKEIDVNSELLTVESNNESSASEQIIDILKKAGKTDKQINASLKDYTEGFGFFIQDANDPNKEYLVINKEQMANMGIVTTAQHELLHKILKNKLANNPELAKQMHDGIQSEVANLDKDVAAAFNKTMESYLKDVSDESKPDYNINNYYEEYFVQFSEFAANNLTNIDKSVYSKIKDFIRTILQKIGFSNIDFKEDNAIDFIKDYNKQFKKGKLSKSSLKTFQEGIKNSQKEGAADMFSKSIKIDDNTKKDIFTKATQAYEDYKEDKSSAGLMVGLEFEPIVRKMLNKYKDLFGMDEYTLDLIANDVMIETRPGYNGIPALVNTWDPEKGASLTSHIYGNLPNRILGIIQNKYPDLGKTVSLVEEKAEQLTTDEGFGGGSGFVDTSSPELYTRVTRKKAEVTMGMSPEYAKRAEEVGERILMSTKLQDLDAKIVGTIKDSEGRTLRVAMLESNKARVYFPDGNSEIVKARTPKVIEQKYGAEEKSFKKIATTRTQMVEDAKAYLIPEMEKEAGGLINNYDATPKYTEFIDKTFNLYKDYLSQSAINKRFADFKEPVIDPKTGKQAREKTAQGNKIFTKRPLALAEWRKYFIGDGTMRIDGRRRSLLEALATEQGFDKVMEVLSKEDMRKQVESRQEELSIDLMDNYVAVIAKSLDRNNPTTAFSKLTLELADLLNKKESEIKAKLISNYAEGKTFYDLPEEYQYIFLREKSNELAKEFNNILENKPKSFQSSELYKKLKPSGRGFMGPIESLTSKQFEKASTGLKILTSIFPKELISLGISNPSKIITLDNVVTNTAVKIKYGLLSRMFNFRQQRKGLYKRTDFANIVNDGFGKELESLKNSKVEIERDYYNKVKSFVDKIKNTTSINKYLIKVEDITYGLRSRKGSTLEKNEKDFFSEKYKNIREGYAREQEIRQELFDILLDGFEIIRNKLNDSEKGSFTVEDFTNFTVNSFFMSTSVRGFRDFSKKEFFDFSPYEGKTKDQHIVSKARKAAEFIYAFETENLSAANRKELLKDFISVMGSGEKQNIADLILPSTYSKDFAIKLMAEEGIEANLDYLKRFKSIESKKSAYDYYLEQAYNKEVNSLLKQDAKAKTFNNQIIESTNSNIVKQSKKIDLDVGLAEMIERKTGISSKTPISAALASNIGKRKGKFDFYLPPNAEDFAGLMYKVYGKGKQGDADMAFIKKHLLDPYNAGEQAISTYKQNLAQDYKSIEKQLGEIEGTVTKETKAELEKLGFNADQAVRVALWNAAGFEIPGIKNIEAAKLRRVVLKDKRLKAYADGVKAIVKGNLFEPSEQWFSSNIRYDLFTHATEGVRPIFLEQWTENTKAIFTPENMNRLKAAYGADYVNNLQSMMDRMKSGKSRGANVGKEVNAALDYLNGSVGVIMWMNTRSAMLQTISAVNYINWGDNNPINIAKTLAKPKEFAATFKEIMNSDFLKQRRSGLEINIEEAEIAKAVEKSKGQASKIFNALIKAGFKPTQIADSFAIAIGGTPLLMNRTKTYQRKGFSLAEAKEKAFNDLREISEENQQSSRQDRVSNIQTGLLGRLVFAFNNTPMQMTRLQKKSALDLINRRGDWKTNVSKLAYYSTIQSVIFYALQQGAALTLFGKDDEDLSESEKENLEKFKEKKIVSLTNSVVDGFLSGSGLPGKVLVTGKNTLAKYLQEEKKGYRADYGNVINEALSISPPLSSKTKKVYSAFKTYRFGSTKKGKKELEQYNDFSPLHPYNVARAKIFSATTNIPVDRVLKKIENLNEAMFNESIEPQIKTALALGWDKWSLGFYDDLYGEDANVKEETKSKNKNTSSRKKAARQRAVKLENMPFKYRDSVRLANYKKRYKK